MENKKKQKPQNFGREVTIKGLIIAGMLVLMLIPQLILQGTIREREYRKDEAVSEISAKWSGAQTVRGPLLTVPFVKEVENKKGQIEKVSTLYTFTPETLHINAVLQPEVRSYGMYEAILYSSSIDMNGRFEAIDAAGMDAGTPDLSKAYITLELSDLRGLSNELVFVFNGREYQAEAGISERYGEKQLVIRPEITGVENGMPFDCRMDLKGSRRMDFIPVGRTTNVELSGAWPHPSFTGNFSPERNIGKESFDAQWSILHYNRDIPDVWSENTAVLFAGTEFGVMLVTGADEYQQNERAVKYAMLFIVLTFVVFFFVEVLTYKRIHPIQYLLVGAALLIFYTLLLSISEIIGFGWAYLISAAATVGLITFYSMSIFKNGKQTLLLSAILAGLYAYLYFILQLENYTLLVGSVGTFVILSAIMFVSRKVNWYKSDAPAEKDE